MILWGNFGTLFNKKVQLSEKLNFLKTRQV